MVRGKEINKIENVYTKYFRYTARMGGYTKFIYIIKLG